MPTFGERLRQLRKEKNLTQDTLAKILFLNKSSISRYEKNNQMPENDLLQRIADYFYVSTDYLLGRSSEKDNTKKTMSEIPEKFTDSVKARTFVNSFVIFGSDGFDSNKLDDDEILQFANELLEHMDTVKYKYKK